jgi:hypothetical protein
MILSGKGTGKLEQAVALSSDIGRLHRSGENADSGQLNHRRMVSIIRPMMPAAGTASSASTG